MPDKLPRPKQSPAATPPPETAPGNPAPGPGPVKDLPLTKTEPMEAKTPHPHDLANGFGASLSNEADQARRLGAALKRLEAARAGLEALIPPEGMPDRPDDATAAAALTEYLGARDQMSDAARAFGPPR